MVSHANAGDVMILWTMDRHGFISRTYTSPKHASATADVIHSPRLNVNNSWPGVNILYGEAMLANAAGSRGTSDWKAKLFLEDILLSPVTNMVQSTGSKMADTMYTNTV